MAKKNPFLWLTMVYLALAMLACRPVTIVVTATPTPTSEVVAKITVSPSEITPTLPPPVTTEAVCTSGAGLVADVTVPDNTVFAPGASFVKTWRVRNTGTCVWGQGTKLIFISGDPMNGPAAVDVPALAPGAQTDISANFIAPASAGKYRANYQLQASDGTRFGPVIYVQIIVPATPTVTPGLPDLEVTGLSFEPASPAAGSPFRVRAVLCNNGSAAAPGVVVRVESRLSSPQTNCYYPPGMFTTLYQTRVNLNPGQSLSVDYPVTINESWHHFVCVKVDPDDFIVEINEGNNAQGQEITVLSGACVAVDPSLQPVVNVASNFGINPGCPTGQAFSVYGAFQKFETNPEDPNPHAHMGAFMIWRSDIRKIYALGLGSEYASPTHNGRWLGVYDDLWEEGQPEVHPSCAGMRVPSGFQLPIRGFGKVWCENSLWASDRMGWPREREWGVDLLIQPTERGLLIRVRNYPDGYHYLFALDFQAGRWVSTAFRP